MGVKVTDEEIVSMYAAGSSLRAIAASIKERQGTYVSVMYVKRHLQKSGVSLRPYQGSGPEHSQWVGGRLPANDGYWRVWVSDDDPMASMRTHQGYVLEHRLVMARALGRPLLKNETVHHINDDPADNALGNLQLRQGKHGKHVVLQCRACGSHDIVPVKIAETTQ